MSSSSHTCARCALKNFKDLAYQYRDHLSNDNFPGTYQRNHVYMYVVVVVVVVYECAINIISFFMLTLCSICNTAAQLPLGEELPHTKAQWRPRSVSHVLSLLSTSLGHSMLWCMCDCTRHHLSTHRRYNHICEQSRIS